MNGSNWGSAGQLARRIDSKLRACHVRFDPNVLDSKALGGGPAKVAVVSGEGLSDDELFVHMPRRIAELLDDEWQMDEHYGMPMLIISMLGSADTDFCLSEQSKRAFADGLHRAADITGAWIFTTGRSTGIVRATVDALDASRDIPFIGITKFDNLRQASTIQEQLQGVRTDPSHYDEALYSASGPDKDVLEANHSHFVLLDIASRVQEQGHGVPAAEERFRTAVEAAFCQRAGGTLAALPSVVLVLGGGPDTLYAVDRALINQQPVVIVTDSGGAAFAISEFLARTPQEEEEILQTKRRYAAAVKAERDVMAEHGKASTQLRAAKRLAQSAKRALLALELQLIRTADSARDYSKPESIDVLRRIHDKRALIEVVDSNALGPTGDISAGVLAAVAKHPKLQKTDLLELAIMWDSKERIEHVFASGLVKTGRRPLIRLQRAVRLVMGSRSSPSRFNFGAVQHQAEMIAALQLAFEQRRAYVITALVSHDVPIARVMLSRLYVLPGRNRFRLFHKLQAQVADALLRLEREDEEKEVGGASERPVSECGHGDAASGAGSGDLVMPKCTIATSTASSAGTMNVLAKQVSRLTVHVADPESRFWMTSRLPPPPSFRTSSPIRGARSTSPMKSTKSMYTSARRPRRVARRSAYHRRILRLGVSVLKHHSQIQLEEVDRWFVESHAFTRFMDKWLRPEHHGLAERNLRRAQNDQLTRAQGKFGTRLQDCFYWAVLMGDVELSMALWRMSNSHLRFALLAADMTFRMMTEDAQGRKHMEEIRTLYDHWEDVAIALLDHIRPHARDQRPGFVIAYAVLNHRVHGQSAMDLAIQLGAKRFIAHQHSQFILTHRWTGSSGGSQMRIADASVPHLKIIAKMFLPFRFVAALLHRFSLGDVLVRVESPGYDDEDVLDDESADRYHPAFHHLYSIPVVKFWSHTLVTQAGFILCFGSLLSLTDVTQTDTLATYPGPVRRNLEAACAIWVAGMSLDYLEMRITTGRSTGTAPSSGFADMSKLQLATLIMLGALRMLHLALGSFGGPVLEEMLQNWLYPVLLACAAVTTFLRLLFEALQVFNTLGVLIICMREMLINNVLKWVVVTLVIAVGFGSAMTAIAPNFTLDPNGDTVGFDLLEEVNIDNGEAATTTVNFSGPNGPSFVPIWALFGFFDVARLERERPWLLSLALVAMMLVMQVLLLNLLIAMMTDTYTAVMKTALVEWKYEYMMLINFYDRAVSPAPAPLNLVLAPVRILVSLVGNSREGGLAVENETQESHEVEHSDETRAFQAYLKTIQEKVQQRADAHATPASVDDTGTQSNVNASGVCELMEVRLRDVDDKIERVYQQINLLHASVEALRGHLVTMPKSSFRELRAADMIPGANGWLHRKARSDEHPDYRGKRSHVLDAQVPWEVEWPDYSPVEWTSPEVLGDGVTRPRWSDDENAATVDLRYRPSFEQAIVRTPLGRPLNPRGRTGMCGRGTLGMWGPNVEARPAVFRRKPSSGSTKPEFQLFTVCHGTRWGMPTKLSNGTEPVIEVLRRSFVKVIEAVSSHERLPREAEDTLDLVFASGGAPVYEGYVDDARNTDNSWLEASVRAFFIRDYPSVLDMGRTTNKAEKTLHVRWLDTDEFLDNASRRVLVDEHAEHVKWAFESSRDHLGMR